MTVERDGKARLRLLLRRGDTDRARSGIPMSGPRSSNSETVAVNLRKTKLNGEIIIIFSNNLIPAAALYN